MTATPSGKLSPYDSTLFMNCRHEARETDHQLFQEEIVSIVGSDHL